MRQRSYLSPGTVADVVDAARETTAATVLLRFTVTEQEVTRALRSRYLSSRAALASLATGICLVALAATTRVAGLDVAAAIGCATGGLYIVGSVGFSYWRGPTKAWRNSAPFHGEQTFVFADDWVEARGPVSESRGSWLIFKDSFETDDSYLLQFRARPVFTVIPRRAFADAQQERHFRGLLARHTKAHLRGAGA